MIRYRSRRPPDTELRACLRDLANQRRGSVLAGSSSRRGKKTSQPASTASNRLYREARRAARKSKVAARLRVAAPILVEAKPIARRSVDFIHDQLAEFGYNRRWMRVQRQIKWDRAVTTRRRFAGSGQSRKNDDEASVRGTVNVARCEKHAKIARARRQLSDATFEKSGCA